MTDQPADPLAFTPAPSTSTRHDGWTAERQRAFVAALSQHGGVAQAARMVGMTPQTANRLRRRPGAADFARAWDLALDMGRQRAWDEAVRRGTEGHLTPVTRNGRVIGPAPPPRQPPVVRRLLRNADEPLGSRQGARFVTVCRNLRNLRVRLAGHSRRTGPRADARGCDFCPASPITPFDAWPPPGISVPPSGRSAPPRRDSSSIPSPGCPSRAPGSIRRWCAA